MYIIILFNHSPPFNFFLRSYSEMKTIYNTLLKSTLLKNDYKSRIQCTPYTLCLCVSVRSQYRPPEEICRTQKHFPNKYSSYSYYLVSIYFFYSPYYTLHMFSPYYLTKSIMSVYAPCVVLVLLLMYVDKVQVHQ